MILNYKYYEKQVFNTDPLVTGHVEHMCFHEFEDGISWVSAWKKLADKHGVSIEEIEIIEEVHEI